MRLRKMNQFWFARGHELQISIVAPRGAQVLVLCSFYEGLYRNYGEPTKEMVVVFEGTLLVSSCGIR